MHLISEIFEVVEVIRVSKIELFTTTSYFDIQGRAWPCDMYIVFRSLLNLACFKQTLVLVRFQLERRASFQALLTLFRWRWTIRLLILFLLLIESILPLDGILRVYFMRKITELLYIEVQIQFVVSFIWQLIWWLTPVVRGVDAWEHRLAFKFFTPFSLTSLDFGVQFSDVKARDFFELDCKLQYKSPIYCLWLDTRRIDELIVRLDLILYEHRKPLYVFIV